MSPFLSGYPFSQYPVSSPLCSTPPYGRRIVVGKFTVTIHYPERFTVGIPFSFLRMEKTKGILPGREPVERPERSFCHIHTKHCINDKSSIPKPETFISIWTWIDIFG